MKNLKLILLLVVAIFTFGTAEAQSVILRVGTSGPGRPPHHRVAPPRRPAPHYRPAPAPRHRVVARGRYVNKGHYYDHRTVYYKNNHKYYRYY